MCLLPIGHLAVAILSFHAALHRKSPQTRLIFFALFVYFAVLSIKTANRFPTPELVSLWVQCMVLNIIHITSVLFIEKIPAPAERADLSSWGPACWVWLASLRSTYGIWCNPQLLGHGHKHQAPPRKVGTSETGEVPGHVPQVPKDRDDDVTVFLLLRLVKLPLYYFLHTRVVPLLFSQLIGGGSSSSSSSSLLTHLDIAQPALFMRSSPLSPREVAVRAYMAVSWIWESFVIFDGANAALSVLAVVTGFDRASDWPSLFGTLGDVDGLRGFWSRFWHRLGLRPYKNFALVAADRLVPVGTSQVARGSVVAFFVFLLSGCSHMAVSWRLGMYDYLDIKWFILNFVACSVERTLISGIRYIAARLDLSRELYMVERSWLGRFIGICWVFGFFFWSVPLWRYPRIQKALLATSR